MARRARQHIVHARLGGHGQLELAQDPRSRGRPVAAGDQEALGVGVATAAPHPDLARPQRRAKLRQQAQLPVMAVDRAVRQVDVRPPAARHEPDRRVVGDTPYAAAVEIAQDLDGLEQLLALGVSAQLQGREHTWCEVAGGAVGLCSA